ncbi:RepA-like replication initiator [Microbacterium phage Blett]|nr:RepA-like replication initiator [Microbacterium phage Blett]
MVWFRVDDAFWSHPKVLALSDAAVALWLRAGSYCAHQLTDGNVRREALPMLRGNEFAADDLVHAGLWIETPTGYVFHDWAKYQPTRASVEAEREGWRQRQRKARGDVTASVTRDSSSQAVDKFTEPVHKFIGDADEHGEPRNSADASRRDSRSPVPFPSHESPNGDSHSATLDVAVDSVFEQVWAQWPRKQSKKVAAAKFPLAARRHPGGVRGLAADIVEHAHAYARFNWPTEFVPMLSTWLNGDRWDDPLPGPRAGSSQQSQNATVLGRYVNGDHE